MAVLCLWDVANGAPITPSLRHDGPVIDADFSPDGLWVLTAAADGTCRFWNSHTGQPLTPVLPHFGPVTGMRFLNAGLSLITGSLDGRIRQWSLSPASEPVERLVEMAQLVSASALLKDARGRPSP